MPSINVSAHFSGGVVVAVEWVERCNGYSLTISSADLAGPLCHIPGLSSADLRTLTEACYAAISKKTAALASAGDADQFQRLCAGRV